MKMVERVKLKYGNLNQRLIPHPPMLSGVSEEDFLRPSSALEDAIKPRDFLEETLVADVAAAVWEILRLRRFKAWVIETQRRSALSNLLWYRLQVMQEEEADRVSARFFSDESARTEVLEILHRSNLDEGAIEAEAMRDVLDQLETADKMLVMAEARRERALRLIDYRQQLAARCRNASDLLLRDGGTYGLPSKREA
jgi:hypothetical protein